ncbi:MAG: hypothetical protein Q4C13_05965, partial [Clostridia bacterium]|nr:hypothetical protein [Clostridia bacterium]
LTPVPTAAPAAFGSLGAGARFLWALPLLGLVISLLLFLIIRRRPIRKKKLAGYVLLMLLPLVTGLLLYALLGFVLPAVAEDSAPAATPAPTG